jgi:hypothetical protein
VTAPADIDHHPAVAVERRIERPVRIEPHGREVQIGEVAGGPGKDDPPAESDRFESDRRAPVPSPPSPKERKAFPPMPKVVSRLPSGL